MPTATAKIQVTAEDKTKRAFNSVQKSLGDLNKNFNSLKAGIGAVIGVGGVGAFITQMASSADKIGKVSAKLGISTDALQKFRFGAEQSGVATSTFDMALQRMTRRVSEAREGTGEAKKALKEMGISLRDSSGNAKTTEQIFMEVADVMKGMTSQSDKVRLAFKLFDSEGVSLVNMMQQGSEAISNYGDQLQRYGGIIDDEAIKASSDFNDALNILSKTSATVFTPLIKGLTFVMRGWKNWVDFFTAEKNDPFDLANKSLEELQSQLSILETSQNKMFESQKQYWKRLDDEDLKGRARQAVQESLELIQSKMVLNSAEREAVEKKILNLSKQTNTVTKTQSNWQGISLKQQEEESKKLDEAFGTTKEVLKLKASLVKESKKMIPLIEKEVDEYIEQQELTRKTKKTSYAIIEGIDGSLHKVSGLTEEQAKALVKANALTRETELYEKAVKKAEKAHQNLTKELEKQKKENREIADAVVGGIRSASSQASRFFNAVGLQIKEVGNSIELAFSTNWIAIVTRFAMSSKKVMGLVDKVFSTFGGAIDNIFDKLLPGIGAANDLVLDTGNNISKVLEKVEELGVDIDDYNMTISGITGEAKEMALIEKQYLENRKLADELGSGFLTHVADLTKQQAILARTTERVARATEAFKQSASSYITALETAGFTDLQKDLFLQAKGFITGPMQIFSGLIKDSKEILSVAYGRLPKAVLEKMELKAFMDETDLGAKKELVRGSQFLMKILGDQLAILDRKPKRSDFTSDVMDPVFGKYKIGEEFDINAYNTALARYVEATVAFTDSIPTKTLELLNGEITSLTDSIELQNGIISTNTDLMNKAQGGLLEMVKETIRSEHESGKSKEAILADIDVVSAKLKEAGLDIASIKAFVGTLTTGAMGGLVKRYPYGGSIHGPSHAGGGVKTELEGGEYVMRKSAVSQYGQDFMNQINSGRFSMGQPIQVSIYDGTGQAIDEYDSAIRVEINQRANRFNQFPALAN